jgi:carbonic anhydrase
MGFSWEPFGRTERDEPETPPDTPPPPQAAAASPAPRALSNKPARALAILTCMDCRIDPLQALGLSLGDAVVLRNAGAQVSDDVLRSLQLAHEALGVRTVHVIGHTDCAAHGGDAEAAAAEAENGAERIRAVIPGLQAGAGLLDLGTGAVQ